MGKRRETKEGVTASSGNVFADIGLAEPEDELTKAQLASQPDGALHREADGRLRGISVQYGLTAYCTLPHRRSYDSVAAVRRRITAASVPRSSLCRLPAAPVPGS
jgi:hypothetical protein